MSYQGAIRPIVDWIIVGRGFWQSGDAPSGTERLWVTLRQQYERAGNGCCVRMIGWRENPRHLAAFIARMSRSAPRGAVRIVLAPYSWATPTCCALGRELYQHGLIVNSMVACDGVYRASWPMPWWLSYRSLFSLRQPVIVVPFGIRSVKYITQSNSRPKGHRLVRAHCGTDGITYCGALLNHDHSSIDDSEKWHCLVMQQCESVFKGGESGGSSSG